VKTPKYLGTVLQKFRPRQGQKPSMAFSKWIDEIEVAVRDKLVPVLRNNGMLLPDEVYKKAGVDLGKPTIQMSDFNSLIALSQKHKAPVFDLSDSQLERAGVVLDRTKKSMITFRRLYSEGADKIIAMTT